MSEEIVPENAAAQREKFLAEAEAAKAQAERFRAEARKTNAEAVELEFATWELEHHKKALEASDELARVYRFDTEVSSKNVKACQQKLQQWSRQDPACDIEIIFSSPGGSIFDGFALFDFIQKLREDGHYVTTGALGMAASMAGILLQAGDVRWIGEQSWILIHRASFQVWGTTYEVEDEVELIKRIEDRIIEIFTTRSELTKTKIQRNWNRKDWWISADEAYEYGLVDEIRGAMLGVEE